jgi:ribosomal protein S18 acetylase RimI-like enzyme
MSTPLHAAKQVPWEELEDAVIDAWPAAEYVELDGWGLRASGGPTRRGNSVATLVVDKRLATALSLEERIAQAEAFYQARKQPVIFQVGPCATPSGLDAALEERGYRVDGEALVAVASPEELLSRLGRTYETSVATRASDAWLEHAGRTGRFSESFKVFEDTLTRLGTRSRFATVRDTRGAVTGTCLGIASEDRLGIYNMLTSPAQRRKGIGKALLRALTESATAERMRELYLLVELENQAARALYAQAGFVEQYRYHYRVRDFS